MSGGAIAQVILRLLTAAARVQLQDNSYGMSDGEVAVDHIFFEIFDFPCQLL
jgi:hypothetical protein